MKAVLPDGLSSEGDHPQVQRNADSGIEQNEMEFHFNTLEGGKQT